ncbi:MAG: FHA domain-containing protein, partial [Jatrophihabitantaceae bacterium]
MRTDLTVRAADGSERDVAVIAPPGVTLGDVRGLLPELAGDPRTVWTGHRQIPPHTVVGQPPLLSGARLTTIPAAAPRCSTWIEIVGGARAGASMPLARRPVTVGRDPACDLVLADPRASRRHAVFDLRVHGANVTDLGSTHGSRLDGRPLHGTSALPPGSIVRIGDSFLAVSDRSGPRASTRAGAGGTLVVNRAPALPPDHPLIVIDRPVPVRPVGRESRVGWLATLLPAALGAVLAWVTGSWEFVAFVALTPVIALTGTLSERR